MTDDAKDVLKITLYPIFLGNNCTSRRLASHLFYRAKVSSLICDIKRNLLDFFSVSYRFCPLYKSLDDKLLAEQLLSIAKKNSDLTLLLIPTNKEYSSAVDRLTPILESQFIITDTENLLICPPIADILA